MSVSGRNACPWHRAALATIGLCWPGHASAQPVPADGPTSMPLFFIAIPIVIGLVAIAFGTLSLRAAARARRQAGPSGPPSGTVFATLFGIVLGIGGVIALLVGGLFLVVYLRA